MASDNERAEEFCERVEGHFLHVREEKDVIVGIRCVVCKVEISMEEIRQILAARGKVTDNVE